MKESSTYNQAYFWAEKYYKRLGKDKTIKELQVRFKTDFETALMIWDDLHDNYYKSIQEIIIKDVYSLEDLNNMKPYRSISYKNYTILLYKVYNKYTAINDSGEPYLEITWHRNAYDAIKQEKNNIDNMTENKKDKPMNTIKEEITTDAYTWAQNNIDMEREEFIKYLMDRYGMTYDEGLTLYMKYNLSEGIKITKDVKLPGLNIVLEKGDRIIKESDYSNIFNDKYLWRKTDYDMIDEAPLNSNQKKALIKIAFNGQTKILGMHSKFTDKVFSDDYTDWIVYIQKNGYFYVNTEGYDYARYIRKIPLDFARCNLKNYF
jgi:hypothetical protein